MRHNEHGSGVVVEFDPANDRGRSYEVRFDNGERHRYGTLVITWKDIILYSIAFGRLQNMGA